MRRRRALFLTLGVFHALSPALFILFGMATQLPGHLWGHMILFVCVVVPLWSMTGLIALVYALCFTLARRSTRRALGVRRVFIMALGWVGLGVGAYYVAPYAPIPYSWTIPRLAARAMERTELKGSVVDVPGDGNPFTRGYFIRENEAASTADLAELRFSGQTVTLPRRWNVWGGGDAARQQWLLATPLRDGWWYVHLDE